MADDIATYGDAARQVMARGRFVVELLGSDLRVIEHYKHWLDERDLPRLNREMHATKTATHIDAKPLLAAIWAEPSDAELDAIARLLRDDMGIRFLDEDPYPWAVPALIMVFQTAAFNDAAPPDLRQDVEVKLEGLSGLDPGRFPRHDGKGIHQDVSWCYQHLIKHPKDDIKPLAKKYAEQENRVTDARSVVQNGIDRAIKWLGLAMSR